MIIISNNLNDLLSPRLAEIDLREQIFFNPKNFFSENFDLTS